MASDWTHLLACHQASKREREREREHEKSAVPKQVLAPAWSAHTEERDLLRGRERVRMKQEPSVALLPSNLPDALVSLLPVYPESSITLTEEEKIILLVPTFTKLLPHVKQEILLTTTTATF